MEEVVNLRRLLHKLRAISPRFSAEANGPSAHLNEAEAMKAPQRAVEALLVVVPLEQCHSRQAEEQSPLGSLQENAYALRAGKLLGSLQVVVPMDKPGRQAEEQGAT